MTGLLSVRNLRTQTFVTAGVACAIDSPRISSLPLGDNRNDDYLEPPS